MRAPFFNGGLFDSMILTRIVEPSENRIDTSAGFHLKVFNDPAFDHVREFAIQGHLDSYLPSFRSPIPFLDCLGFAHVLASFGLPVPLLAWPKIFPRAGVYPDFGFGRGCAVRIGRRSVHARSGISRTMVAGDRGGADVIFVSGDPVGCAVPSQDPACG